MRNILLLLLTTFPSFFLAGQNYQEKCGFDNPVSTLGIGLVIVPTSFVIYNDSLLTDTFQYINMYQDKPMICSKFHKPDYGIMHFVCLSITGKSYKVLTNYSEYKYLPKNGKYLYQTWGKYILSSYGVRRFYDQDKQRFSDQPIRALNNNTSDTVNIPKGLELLCPLEIREDWIRVKYDCFYSKENNEHEGAPCQKYVNKCNPSTTGWLKWRQDNKLLIDIFLMP
jgi:hypothetical protein